MQYAVMLSLRFINDELRPKHRSSIYFFVRWLIINTLKNKLKIVEKRLGYLERKYYL